MKSLIYLTLLFSSLCFADDSNVFTIGVGLDSQSLQTSGFYDVTNPKIVPNPVVTMTYLRETKKDIMFGFSTSNRGAIILNLGLKY